MIKKSIIALFLIATVVTNCQCPYGNEYGFSHSGYQYFNPETAVSEVWYFNTDGTFLVEANKQTVKTAKWHLEHNELTIMHSERSEVYVVSWPDDKKVVLDDGKKKLVLKEQ